MPPDQPRPEVKPTREHREAAYRLLWPTKMHSESWLERGDSSGILHFENYALLLHLANILASRDAEAEGRGRRLEREAVIRFLNAQPTGVSLPSCAQAIGSEVHLATPAAPETKT